MDVRLFVGVAVPEVPLEGAQVSGPDAPAHLTVLFLGEVPADRAGTVAEHFATAVRSHPPFPLELAGMGVFPNSARPRVVWGGVTAGATELRSLRDRLAESARELQLPVEDRPFVPHLTLRRIRGPRDAELARRWVEEFGARSFGRVQVTELELKESLLGAGPSCTAPSPGSRWKGRPFHRVSRRRSPR